MNIMKDNKILFDPKFRPDSRAWLVEGIRGIYTARIQTVTLYKVSNKEAIQYNVLVNGKVATVDEGKSNLFNDLEDAMAKLKDNIRRDKEYREKTDKAWEESHASREA